MALVDGMTDYVDELRLKERVCWLLIDLNSSSIKTLGDIFVRRNPTCHDGEKNVLGLSHVVAVVSVLLVSSYVTRGGCEVINEGTMKNLKVMSIVD